MSTPLNPLRGGNKLKFGVFGLNGDTNPVEHLYQFDWETSLNVAQMADEAGFEAVVPYARWRSLAAPVHFTSHVFDSTTWAAAVAGRTRNCAIMSTIHVTTMHPVMAARMLTTLDHVAGGRFALNIVCGWFEAEMKMFGQQLLPHDERYAYADEWISAIKAMWSSEDPVDFDGKYIKMKQGVCLPKPLQRPHPLLMNAGGSADGRAFVAKHCDIAFISNHEADGVRREAEAYRRQVRETTGREVQIWVPCAVIQGETMAEALEIADSYMARADALFLETAFQPGSPYLRNWDGSPEQFAVLQSSFILAGGNFLLLGSADQIADQMKQLSDSGVDGLLFTWAEPVGGIQKFRASLLPRLVEAGLRDPAS